MHGVMYACTNEGFHDKRFTDIRFTTKGSRQKVHDKRFTDIRFKDTGLQ